MSKKKKSKKPKGPLLIDQLAEALTKIGIKFDRDGWREVSWGTPPNDPCQWLDIHLFSPKKTRRYTVHLYFTHGATKLEEVELFISKKRTGYHEPSKKLTK